MRKKLRLFKLYFLFYIDRIKHIFYKPKIDENVSFIYEDED